MPTECLQGNNFRVRFFGHSKRQTLASTHCSTAWSRRTVGRVYVHFYQAALTRGSSLMDEQHGHGGTTCA